MYLLMFKILCNRHCVDNTNSWKESFVTRTYITLYVIYIRMAASLNVHSKHLTAQSASISAWQSQITFCYLKQRHVKVCHVFHKRALKIRAALLTRKKQFYVRSTFYEIGSFSDVIRLERNRWSSHAPIHSPGRSRVSLPCRLSWSDRLPGADDTTFVSVNHTGNIYKSHRQQKQVSDHSGAKETV